ncbi:peptidylprolyl isomerase [Candidatus Azambacteria bacterium]|nr:peptidylprolyl isomerase [Candidatus Azambacteria bacterium]
MKPNNIISLLVLVAVAGAGIYYFMYRTTTTTIMGKNIVVIETDKGTIKAELRPEEAPKTVANFIGLVEKKFYDGLVFHRVVPNFVIQGGDPKGDGTGGSGANIPLEIKCQDGAIMEGKEVTCPVALPHSDGALAMARSADPNSASSQFYITIGEQAFLDGKYAVFGYVTEGKDIVRLIEQGSTIKKIHLE